MQTLTSHAAKMAAFCIGLAILLTTPASAQSPRDQARKAVEDGDYTTAARLYEEAIKQSPKDETVLTEAGDANMELERYATARDLYARAYDLDDDDMNVIRKYGAALSLTGEHPRAIQLLAGAVKEDASLENYLALGNAYLRVKDSLSRAELTFQTAGTKYPNSADIAVALGDLYFAREIYELAQQKYEEALKVDQNLIEPRIRLGRSYRELAKRAANSVEANEFYNKALLEFNRVTALAPLQARPWREQGEIFLLAEQYENAGRSFQTYVELRPEDPYGDIYLARAAFGGNFYPQAIAPLERIIAKSDSVSRSYADTARGMLGKSYYAAKDYVKAREIYALVNPASLDQEATKLYASSIFLSGGDTLKALDLYRKIVEANPSDCDLSMSLGSLLYTMKRYDDVVDVFTKRMANCPDAAKGTPYLYMGLSHFARNRYDDAITALNSSIAADSSSAQAYFWLMNVYAKKEQYAQAGKVADMMVRQGLDKSNPKEVATGYFFGGVDRFKAKDYKGAIAQFDRAIKLQPEYAQAYLYTAYSYQSQSDKDNACRYYNLVLKYDPKNADARNNLKAVGCQ